MNIYVGNLNYNLKESDLEELFSQFGEVISVKIVKDQETGRAKGFGFVEMADESEGAQAIEKLDGADVRGRNIKVNQANPKAPRGGRPERNDRFQKPQQRGSQQRPSQRRENY
ncbi:RNA recognition motif domain-containing protein [Gaoshiqia sp. Z1-71]|uniref:RNA recognition motif domain-containing protein n=1 Tax=Gaoshiqia hydrogeniformans TaxID=3290090 RepID=UPI003BF82585